MGPDRFTDFRFGRRFGNRVYGFARAGMRPGLILQAHNFHRNLFFSSFTAGYDFNNQHLPASHAQDLKIIAWSF